MQHTTVVPLDFKSAKTVQTGDIVSVDITIRNTFPNKKVKRVYRVMTVDRINELADCVLLNEIEV